MIQDLMVMKAQFIQVRGIYRILIMELTRDYCTQENA